MSTNPITSRRAETGSTVGPPLGSTKQEREAYWVARGNRLLWGQELTTKGEALEPRYDLEWRCVNGNYFLASRGQ